MLQLDIAPAVAGPAVGPKPVNAVTDAAPDLPDEIVGVWVSDERDTNRGRMRFEFRFGSDGTLDVRGTPLDGAAEKEFHNHGPYRLDGNSLVTPALNLGQPVRVWLDDGHLMVVIHDTLEFRLRRK
jgi:hypothetical protein